MTEVSLWLGVLNNHGKPRLPDDGFHLYPGSVATLSAPTGWSGRIWARTGCTFDDTGKGKCTTADSGGALKCNGVSGVPPATLAEFSLDNPSDYYDIGIIDGFNIPISIIPSMPNCPAAECTADLNKQSQRELQVVSNGTVVACKGACLAFGQPEYCCTAKFNNPETYKPSEFSLAFKNACPKAHTFAFDHLDSTFTCKGADYLVTFS